MHTHTQTLGLYACTQAQIYLSLHISSRIPTPGAMEGYNATMQSHRGIFVQPYLRAISCPSRCTVAVTDMQTDSESSFPVKNHCRSPSVKSWPSEGDPCLTRVRTAKSVIRERHSWHFSIFRLLLWTELC